MKYDLRLIGNIIIDDVYKIDSWPKENTSNKFTTQKLSIGGIGNIIRALHEKDMDIIAEGNIGKDKPGHLIENFCLDHNIARELYWCDKPTSKALILSGKDRTSFVNWGCGTDILNPSPTNAKWTHICYLDIIPTIDVSYIKKYSDIVSADLCLSNPSKENIELVLNQLQHLDYLIVSETEFEPLSYGLLDISNFIEKYNLKNLILHTKYKTIIANNNSLDQVMNNHAIVENIDVLGAGDVYCANFIYSQLFNGLNLSDTVKSAHIAATNHILSYKF
jgi:sugar/nucleoside kinase (ribokinase family)